MTKSTKRPGKVKRYLDAMIRYGTKFLMGLLNMLCTYAETAAEHLLGVSIILAIFICNWLLEKLHDVTNWLCQLMTDGASKLLLAYDQIKCGDPKGWLWLVLGVMIVFVVPALGKWIFRYLCKKYTKSKG